MKELAEVARSPEHPGGDCSNLFRPIIEVPTPPLDTIHSQLFNKDVPEAERQRILFTTLKKHPRFRHSLPSINAARAFKYGSRSFGRKQWYTEDFNVIRGLKSADERRTFRFGSKSNVGFLIQLDLETLKSCLLDKTFNPNTTPSNSHLPSLSDGSFLDTMRHMDYTRFQRFCTVLKRIQANLEFTQSLSEYFATDDMLEPALLVVSETIRRSLNLQQALRGGSVAAHSLLYRHRASSRDHDFSERRYPRERRSQNSSTTTSKYRSSSSTPTYPIGSCWRFQSSGSCSLTNCPFDHACCHCHSESHGKESCPALISTNK